MIDGIVSCVQISLWMPKGRRWLRTPFTKKQATEDLVNSVDYINHMRKNKGIRVVNYTLPGLNVKGIRNPFMNEEKYTICKQNLETGNTKRHVVIRMDRRVIHILDTVSRER